MRQNISGLIRLKVYRNKCFMLITFSILCIHNCWSIIDRIKPIIYSWHEHNKSLIFNFCTWNVLRWNEPMNYANLKNKHFLRKVSSKLSKTFPSPRGHWLAHAFNIAHSYTHIENRIFNLHLNKLDKWLLLHVHRLKLIANLTNSYSRNEAWSVCYRSNFMNTECLFVGFNLASYLYYPPS